jgi:hypothetical protein
LFKPPSGGFFVFGNRCELPCADASRHVTTFALKTEIKAVFLVNIGLTIAPPSGLFAAFNLSPLATFLNQAAASVPGGPAAIYGNSITPTACC